MLRFTFILVLVGFCQFAWSQTNTGRTEPTPNSPDVIVSDSIAPKEKGRFKKNWKQPYPNPVRAGIYGLVIPGAGQFYNKRYWKVPLVWGAVGGVVYWADFSAKQYNRFNTAYGLRLASERTNTEPTDEFVGIAQSSDALKTVRDRHDKNRQTGIIAVIAVHTLQALEAYVDAHLRNFDIDDDLSLQLRPVMDGSDQSGTYVGIGLVASF